MVQGFASKTNLTSISLPSDSAPIGSIQAYPGANAPAGWLICDGSAVSRTTYASLFAITGTMYGVGDGSTTFNIPDLRGIFVRGSGISGKLTTAIGTAVSGSLSTYQNDSIQGHSHGILVKQTTGAVGAGDIADSNAAGDFTRYTSASYQTDGARGVPRIGYETNPANLSLTYIIKASQVLTDVIIAQNTVLHPVGMVAMFGGSIAPYGWSMCDGSAISRTEYADLFTTIGTTYGIGDGSTTFNLPDCRGIFVRGAGTSGKLTMAVGTACSGTLGVYENDKIQGHKTRIDLISASSAAGTNVVRTGDLSGGSSAKDSSIVTDSINGTPRTGAETNPANLSLNYIIKSRNVTNNYQSTFPPIITGSAAPAITPQYVGQEYIDTVAKRQYKAMDVSSSSDWQKQSIYKSGTGTVLAGSDLTISLDFDWSGGYLTVWLSDVVTDWDSDGSPTYQGFTTSYDALTNSGYTARQVIVYATTGVINNNKTSDEYGQPKSATTKSFTLDTKGTQLYVKWFVWA